MNKGIFSKGPKYNMVGIEKYKYRKVHQNKLIIYNLILVIRTLIW